LKSSTRPGRSYEPHGLATQLIWGPLIRSKKVSCVKSVALPGLGTSSPYHTSIYLPLYIYLSSSRPLYLLSILIGDLISSVIFLICCCLCCATGTWLWASTSRPMLYENWCPGEPNNSGGEHYAALDLDRSCWNDDSDRLHACVCMAVPDYIAGKGLLTCEN